jgi:hypothetical protein
VAAFCCDARCYNYFVILSLGVSPMRRREFITLLGEDLTYERKIREMIVASRVEHALSKAEILELYLNSVYLGRSS